MSACPSGDRRRPPSRRLGTVSEAAAEYGVSPKTIRRRIADGSLPAFRVGRVIRIDLDAAQVALMRPMNDAARSLLVGGVA